MILTPGQVLSLVEAEVLSESRIRAFAMAGADASPAHLSDEAAKAVNFPKALAHGILGMAFLSRLLLGYFPQSSLMLLKARFVAMTFHGDQLTCTARVDRMDAAEGRAHLTLTARNQDGKVVLTGSASVKV